MLDIQKNTSISVDRIYQSYISFYENELAYDILLRYNGEFSVSLIRSFAEGIEQMMTKLGDRRHIIKRMFSIIVEGLQNIYIHGGLDEEEVQTAFLIIARNNTNYKILFGNIVDQEDKSPIKTYLGNINNHSEEELKQLHLSKLKNGYLSQKGGAGLGIITMRIKSSNNLQYRIYDVSPAKSFLVIEVELNRK